MRRVGADEPLRGSNHRGNGTLHVGGAAPDEVTVALDCRERIGGPLIDGSGRDDVDVPGETDQRRCVATPRPQVRDAATIDPLAVETERSEARRNQSQAAGIVGRHRATGDQVPGERQRGGVTVVVRRGGFHVAAFRSYQSRSSSLMEVLARVWASTRLTMTAQESE